MGGPRPGLGAPPRSSSSFLTRLVRGVSNKLRWGAGGIPELRCPMGRPAVGLPTSVWACRPADGREAAGDPGGLGWSFGCENR